MCTCVRVTKYSICPSWCSSGDFSFRSPYLHASLLKEGMGLGVGGGGGGEAHNRPSNRNRTSEQDGTYVPCLCLVGRGRTLRSGHAHLVFANVVCGICEGSEVCV